MSALALAPAARDRAALRRTFGAARPFKHAVIDGFLPAAACRALRSELSRPLDAHFLEGRELKGSFAICRDPGPIGPGFARLEELLGSPAFIGWLEAVTGVGGLSRNREPSCGGLFRFDQDSEMDIHLDSNDVDAHCAQVGHRRKINLLLYLTHGWRESWGGLFEIYRDPSRPPERALAPLFNRCVIFDSHERSWHGVTRVTVPDGAPARYRYVMIANYFTRDAGGRRPAPAHYNVWMPRPLPGHFKAGRRLTMTDALEIGRLLLRRDTRLKDLRSLEEACRALRAGAPVAASSISRPAGRAFDILKVVPPCALPGRVLARRDVAELRGLFARRDRELRRLYRLQYGYIQTLKKEAPAAVPEGY